MVESILPVRSTPLRSTRRGISRSRSPSPDKNVMGLMKVITLCAMSATFAAVSTTLLGLSIMSNPRGSLLTNSVDGIGVNIDTLQAQEQTYVGSRTSHIKRRMKTDERENERKLIVKEKTDGQQSGFDPSKEFDFAIIGWPKTGTSFLLNILAEHPEVTMPKKEVCDMIRGEKSLKLWMEHKEKKSKSRMPQQKYGFKCPTMIQKTESIENLAKLSDSTRLVIGLRHPILWFQSFYNYRVKENYDLNLPRSNIVSPNDLVGTNHWNGCSTALAQYDMFLKQLAKVSLTRTEMIEMSESSMNEDSTLPVGHWIKRISPNPFKLFIYTPEQLSDKNVKRQEQFRRDLQEFLRLESPLQSFEDAPKINSNEVTYPEYIDICDPEFTSLRNSLLIAGERSSEWIRSKFMKSDDVIVSDKDFFVENIMTWSVDPCSSSRETTFQKESTLIIERKNPNKEERKFVQSRGLSVKDFSRN